MLAKPKKKKKKTRVLGTDASKSSQKSQENLSPIFLCNKIPGYVFLFH